MSRQRLNRKKLEKLRRETGLPIVAVLVRGNTDHRRDLWLEDSSIVHLYRDGDMEKSDIQHGFKLTQPY